MGIFDFIFKKNHNKINREIIETKQNVTPSTIPDFIMPDLPDSITTLSVDGFLDATNEANIALFKNNLQILIKETKAKGEINKYVLLRSDDFLPDDWIWRANSKYTAMELKGTELSYAVKNAFARRLKPNYNPNASIEMPIFQEEMFKLLSQIEKTLGFVKMPAHFRSTKHFTINVPLALTHRYNVTIASNRLFTVIDNADNFFNSPYAYSAAYHDAYLDITHEGMPISKEAIVLIAEDKYNKIKDNPQIINQLQNRRLIIFKGAEEVAIPMFLTELGILPTQVGGLYAHYDDELTTIIENSMKATCHKYNIAYDISHGGITKRHFSDDLDRYNQEITEAQNEFISFLKNKFPTYKDKLSSFIRHSYISEEVAESIVKEFGPEYVLNIIKEYNNKVMSEFEIRKANYQQERDNMTEEIKNTFRETIKLIKLYYDECLFEKLSVDEQNQFQEQMLTFFHSAQVNTQYEVAKLIVEKISEIHRLTIPTNSIINFV